MQFRLPSYWPGITDSADDSRVRDPPMLGVEKLALPSVGVKLSFPRPKSETCLSNSPGQPRVLLSLPDSMCSPPTPCRWKRD